MLTSITRNSRTRGAWLSKNAVSLVAGFGLAIAGSFPVNAAISVSTVGGGPQYPNPIPWAGSQDGVNASAQFNTPYGCALSAGGYLYVADKANHAIRKMGVATGTSGATTTPIKFASPALSPIGVAIDPAKNLYILTLEDYALRKYDLVASRFVWTNKFASLPSAVTVAQDSTTTNVYVSLANGSVYSVTMAGVKSVLYTNFKSPLGLAWMPSGRLAVSDGGNNSIWLLNPATKTVQWLAGLTNQAAGFADGANTAAKFNQPTGLAATGDGSLIVADQLNNRVRLVAKTGTVSTLYGVSSSDWGSVSYPGWLDSSLGTAQSRQPAGVILSSTGDIYVTELYYSLVRKASGSGLSLIVPTPGGGGSTNLNPTTPSFSPSYGYFLGDQNITVSNAVGAVYYTTDGVTDPAVNGQLVVGGQIIWNDINRDLSSLQMRSYSAGVWSPPVSGQVVAPTTPVITPACGFYPAGRDIVVTNAVGSVVFYTTDGNDPDYFCNAITLTNGVGVIHWADSQHGLNWLHLRACTGLAPSQFSDMVAGENCSIPAPILSPKSGVFPYSTNIQVGCAYSGYLEFYYNTNRTDPTMSSTFLSTTNNRGLICWPAYTDLSLLRVIAYNGPENPSPVSGGIANSFPPTTPTFTPMSGYFVGGQTITVYNTIGNVYYTTDGTEPTINSLQVPMVNGVGTIQWRDGLHDLSFLRIKAFNGTQSSPTVSGLASPANLIGVPRDFKAGIGSTLVVPVVANLIPNQKLGSLMFRMEITPLTPGGAAIQQPVQLLQVTLDDFVPVAQPTSDGNPLFLQSGTYQANGITNVLWISSVGEKQNLSMENYGVLANLKIQIPSNAIVGDTYSMKFWGLSGASPEGSILSVQPMNATIFVTNIAFHSSDCAVGSWYNAGDFGDGTIDIGDVNAAFDASTGHHLPPIGSDAFRAMDVFPVGAKRMGDNAISYLDWQHIQAHVLGLETYTWTLSWSAGGMFTVTLDTPPNNALMAKAATQNLVSVADTNNVWVPQALISAGTLTNVTPGSTVTLPIYAKVLRGFSLAGLQFRADLLAPSNAPSVGSLTFLGASDVPMPQVRQYSTNETMCSWDLGSLIKPVQGASNVLGYVRFTVPSTAKAGQSYTVKVSYSSGAADWNTGYDLESAPGSVWVGSAAPPVGHFVSDEWKTHFFGDRTNVLADPEADSDGDGVPNWQEYRAGTDPTRGSSRLEFSGVASQTNSVTPGVTLRWNSAPGRDYMIEASTGLSGANWSAISTNIPGDGSPCAYTQTNLSGAARFYRIRLQQ